jgi:hypothetical protein
MTPGESVVRVPKYSADRDPALAGSVGACVGIRFERTRSGRANAPSVAPRPYTVVDERVGNGGFSCPFGSLKPPDPLATDAQSRS